MFPDGRFLHRFVSLVEAKRFDERGRIVLLLALLACGLSLPSPSYAATLTVCASGCNDTTIAAAIAAASAGDTISIKDAVHTEANITVSKDLTIKSEGAAGTAVDGGASGTVFTISGGVTATIQDMTIRNGSGVHGGISNNGTVTISRSTLSGNSASADGGGIDSIGTVTISNSTISGNSTIQRGGGVANSGTVTISNSTLSGNSTIQHGGGIASIGTATISKSTLSDNSATVDGGGIFNTGTGSATLTRSTVTKNVAGGDGGGIFNNGTLTISPDSTVFKNSPDNVS
jgi:hypothetical protein